MTRQSAVQCDIGFVCESLPLCRASHRIPVAYPRCQHGFSQERATLNCIRAHRELTSSFLAHKREPSFVVERMHANGWMLWKVIKRGQIRISKQNSTEINFTF